MCRAHNFNFVPGTRNLVMGWWQAGTSVVDLPDPRRPKEIAFFQPDTSGVVVLLVPRPIYVNSRSGAWVLEVPALKR